MGCGDAWGSDVKWHRDMAPFTLIGIGCPFFFFFFLPVPGRLDFIFLSWPLVPEASVLFVELRWMTGRLSGEWASSLPLVSSISSLDAVDLVNGISILTGVLLLPKN